MEPNIPRNRLYLLAGFLAAVLLAYLGVLFNTQVVDHEDYLAKSVHSIAREETVSASRGIITDRNGRTLVSNSSAYDLTFDTDLLRDGEDQNLAILRLIQLCQEQELTWVDNLPITSSAPYSYTLERLTENQRKQFWRYLLTLPDAKAALGDYLMAHPNLAPKTEEAEETQTNGEAKADTAADLLDRFPAQNLTAGLLNGAGLSSSKLLELMESRVALPQGLTATQRRQILGIRYNLAIRRQTGYSDCVITEDITTEFISMVSDGQYAGAKITTSSHREYQTSAAAHILGYVTDIWAEDLERLKDKGYDGDDTIGRTGVEAAFEEYLRGKDGRRVISVNDQGQVTGQYYEVEPEPGNTVELTIDLELQQAAEEALAETISDMTAKDGIDDRGGAAAVVKVGTGEVLALANYPTYDLSTFRESDIYAELEANPAKPFQNRATSTSYAPGSTFKPLTAVAALESGVVTLTEKFRDPGVWYYPDMIEGTEPFKAHCWKRSGHGKLNITEAITNSCNVFFYEMGYRLGIENLDEYARAFGLGEKTGIEIGETAGVLAGPEHSAEVGQTWYGGMTTQAAIGQSDNLFTPLQLANYIATLVSGGQHCQAHLLKAVKTYDSSKIVAVGNTQPLNTVSFSDSTLQAVKEGMRGLTIPGGSLAGYFKDCIVTAGAKTGTAQLGGGVKNNGVLVCFAPYEEPEIAVAIVIEKGDSGAALASTAVKILNTYFSADETNTTVIGENQLMP